MMYCEHHLHILGYNLSLGVHWVIDGDGNTNIGNRQGGLKTANVLVQIKLGRDALYM